MINILIRTIILLVLLLICDILDSLSRASKMVHICKDIPKLKDNSLFACTGKPSSVAAFDKENDHVPVPKYGTIYIGTDAIQSVLENWAFRSFIV